MDFAATKKLLPAPLPIRARSRAKRGDGMVFVAALQLEENPNTQSEAIAAYQQVLDLEPNHPAAHINLGTLYYNRQEYAQAERHYRQRHRN